MKHLACNSNTPTHLAPRCAKIISYLVALYLLGTLVLQAQITGMFGATNDTIAIRTNSPQLFNILRNDYTIYDFDIKTFEIINQPKGKAKVVQDKGIDKLEYIPDANNAQQNDLLTYKICDKQGKCDTASICIFRCPEGNPSYPVVNTYTVPKNGQREFAHSGFKILFSQSPRVGTIVLNVDSSAFVYKAKESATGCDTLKYDVYEVRNKVCGYIRTEGHNLYLQVIPSQDNNKAPIAQDDHVTIYGTYKTDIDVLANDSDPEGNLERKIKEVGDAKNGKIKYSQKGIISYTPQQKFIGKEKISYTICDYNGACAVGYVHIEVKKEKK